MEGAHQRVCEAILLLLELMEHISHLANSTKLGARAVDGPDAQAKGERSKRRLISGVLG
jgi:hypothetical protein